MTDKAQARLADMTPEEKDRLLIEAVTLLRESAKVLIPHRLGTDIQSWMSNNLLYSLILEKRESAADRAARLGFSLESATGENIDVITGKRFNDE